MPIEESITKSEPNTEIQIRTLDDVEVPSNVVSLPAKVQRFVNLYMTGQYTVVKLAELLEVHPNTINKWLKRRDVKDVILDMQKMTQDVVSIQLKALQSKAVARLNSLLDSPIDGVAYQAVKDILDRGGHKAKQEIKIDKTVVTYEQKLQDLINNVIQIDDYEVVDDDDYE